MSFSSWSWGKGIQISLSPLKMGEIAFKFLFLFSNWLFWLSSTTGRYARKVSYGDVEEVMSEFIIRSELISMVGTELLRQLKRPNLSWIRKSLQVQRYFIRLLLLMENRNNCHFRLQGSFHISGQKSLMITISGFKFPENNTIEYNIIQYNTL